MRRPAKSLALLFGHSSHHSRNRRRGAIFYWLGRPQQMSDPIKMGIGIASGLAALLACLQTFLGLSQRADQHKLARDRYARTAGAWVNNGAAVVADANAEDTSDRKLEEHVAA